MPTTRSPKGSRVILPSGEIFNIHDNAGNLQVSMQDQIDPAFISPLVRLDANDTVAVATTKGAKTFTVSDSTGFAVGQYVHISHSSVATTLCAIIKSIDTNDITINIPINNVYPIGAGVTGGVADMSVNGSVTPVSFVMRRDNPRVDKTIHINRIIMQCQADSAVDLNKFGNLAALANGIYLRHVDPVNYRDLFFARTNAELAALGYDFTIYQASGPFGIDGFAARITFSSQEKMGVSIEVEPDQDIELLVQDNLTSLTSLTVMVEGHYIDSQL